MSALRLMCLLHVCLASGNAQTKSEVISGYWEGPRHVVFQEDNSKIIQALFFQADSNHSATLRSLPIFIESGDTSYGGPDGPSFIESGTFSVVGDTLIFEISKANAGPGGPIKHGQNRIFKILKGSIIEIRSNTKYKRIKKKAYIQLLKIFWVSFN